MSGSKRLDPGTNISVATKCFVDDGARAHNYYILSTVDDYMPSRPVPWVVRGSKLGDPSGRHVLSCKGSST